MKKLLIFAIAALMMGACAKVETPEFQDQSQKEITFAVAKYLQTKATGKVYENGAFGTYAWYTTPGYDVTDFMVNEEVDFIGGVWKTKNHTFYWPKTGSIDFISYSPYDTNSVAALRNPVVYPDSLVYTAVNVAAVDTTTNSPLNIDYMYADKACASKNVDRVNDGVDSGFTGVPTIFRHALAKVSFNIKANFLEWVDTSITPNDTTKWEITVTSAKISGLKTTGDLKLTLNTDEEGVTIPWNKPDTTVNGKKYHVWSKVRGLAETQELLDTVNAYPGGMVLADTLQTLDPVAGFVMPQVLTEGAKAQKLALKMHIKTYLPNGFVIEEDYEPCIDIKKISSLKAWEMNQNIVYTINIKPTAIADANGNNDSPEDVTITFDPAVADWTEVSANATIQI